MHSLFALSLVSFVLPVVVLAGPFPVPAPFQPHKRALTLRAYNDMSISDGTAGNAKAEAEAVWAQGLDLSDLTAISSDDLDVLQTERENAEDAETEAFNPAIDAAGKSTTQGKALQCGKIKNKVLKLTGESQVNQIKLAQAGNSSSDASDLQAALDDSNTKLATNIKLDEDNAGASCSAVSFVGKTSV